MRFAAPRSRWSRELSSAVRVVFVCATALCATGCGDPPLVDSLPMTVDITSVTENNASCEAEGTEKPAWSDRHLVIRKATPEEEKSGIRVTAHSCSDAEDCRRKAGGEILGTMGFAFHFHQIEANRFSGPLNVVGAPENGVCKGESASVALVREGSRVHLTRTGTRVEDVPLKAGFCMGWAVDEKAAGKPCNHRIDVWGAIPPSK